MPGLNLNHVSKRESSEHIVMDKIGTIESFHSVAVDINMKHTYNFDFLRVLMHHSYKENQICVKAPSNHFHIIIHPFYHLKVSIQCVIFQQM